MLVEMIGGYQADLTTSQRNAWAEYILAQPAYLARGKAISSMLALQLAVQGGAASLNATLAQTMDAVDELTTALFALAKQWVAEHAPQESPERKESA